jgi:hypothetical protein
MLHWHKLFPAFIVGLAMVFCVTSARAQKPEEPRPLRLEKKVRPTDPAKPADKEKPKPKAEDQPKTGAEKPPTKGEPDEELKKEDPEALEREVQETINRLSKNFRTVEDKLQKKDPGEGTQTVQRDIIKDLDELIDQTRKQEEQMQQQQQNQQNQQQQQGQKKGQSKRQRSLQAQRNRQQRNRSAQRQRQQGQQQLSRQQGQQQEEPQGTGANPPDGAAKSGEWAAKSADLYKDIWGHLPETLRQEMTQYTREQFMPKYNELLKQYYATIAEKGRKQGDR